MLISLCFISDFPIWDERIFFPTIKTFGANYIPDLEIIKNMFSPMGPVFFTIWGLIGKLLGFDIQLMRLVHILFAFGFMILLFRIFQKFSLSPIYSVFIFILNPYFFVMTAPLLYTDITAMFFVYGGIYFYFHKKQLILSSVLFGIAICTRQLYIIFPVALFLVDLYLLNSEFSFKRLVKHSISFLMFLPFYILWDFNVNSGAFGGGSAFEENTLEAFSFSLKTFNYSLILIGIYTLPFLRIHHFKKNVSVIISTVFCSFLLFFGFPKNVNAGMQYGSLPDTAGLLDIFFVKIGVFAYFIIPTLFILSFWNLFRIYQSPHKPILLFAKILIPLFVLLESVYSYCWDKHFMVIIPFILILASQEEGERPELKSA